jgi:hypothetical protein
MSFSLGRPSVFGGGVAAASGGGQVQMGPDLEEISTEVVMPKDIAFTTRLLLNSFTFRHLDFSLSLVMQKLDCCRLLGLQMPFHPPRHHY